MASDIFFKIGDIKGESLDDKHKDLIEVMSWSWGVTQTGTMGRGSGGGGGKGELSDLSFAHSLDKASPVLLQYCANGKHIPEATLTQRKAGGKQEEFLVIKLYDILISSVQDGGSDGGAPTESVALNFTKAHLAYKPQKADGSLDSDIHFKWDVKKTKDF